MGVVHRFTGTTDRFDWEGVTPEEYGENDSGCRRVLIGESDGATHFQLRYFEIPTGASSSLDIHEHDHGVYILRGVGSVLLGEQKVEVRVNDVIYIPPNEPHRLDSIGDEPLGFLCIAPPKPLQK